MSYLSICNSDEGDVSVIIVLLYWGPRVCSSYLFIYFLGIYRFLIFMTYSCVVF